MSLSEHRHYELGEYVYSEHKVKLAVKELIKWINLSDDMTKVDFKYRNYIHKANLRRRINKVFGDKLI